MARLRAINGKQVRHDDHRAPYASTRDVLERLLCGPSDEDDMGLLELTHTGRPIADKTMMRTVHQLFAESHVRVLTASHGFATLVPIK